MYLQGYLRFYILWRCYHPASLDKQSLAVETKVSSTSTLTYKSVFDGYVTNLGLIRIICLPCCHI